MCGTRCVIIDGEYFPKSRASALKYQNYTKRKQGVRYLFSKPRRSLYRLRLKFEETTRVVCTDYSWSLQKVLRTYKFKCVYLLKWVRRTRFWGALPRANRFKIQANYECLQARHSCKAQGGMRAKPDMKPWVNTYKTKKELRRGAALSARVFVAGSAAPTGLKICWLTINPGLAPWAMREYRPYRAHLLRLSGQYTLWDHCIIRHSLRYYRHSGLVIYKSKLPAPSASMPCDYRILQSSTKRTSKTCPFGDRATVSLLFWCGCPAFGEFLHYRTLSKSLSLLYSNLTST